MPGCTPLSDSTPEGTHNPSLREDAASIGGTSSVEMELGLLSTAKNNRAPSFPPSRIHTESDTHTVY